MVADDYYSFEVDGIDVIPPAAYYVLGTNDDLSTNGGAVVDYAANWTIYLNNYSAETVAVGGNQGIIDSVLYDTTWPFAAGVSMNLDPAATDATSNDDVANWCGSISTYGMGDFGTPGSANDSCN